MDLIVEPGMSVKGRIELPGDKSISHRSIMCASLASGTSIIKGFPEGEDCLRTLKAFQDLGIKIKKRKGLISVEGRGLYGLEQPENSLNLGNSGTSMRLLAGILAGQHFNSILIGDKSLSKRPMRRITDPLKEMGFSIQSHKGDTPPLMIKKVEESLPIDYELPIASAQVKSCLLFASLYTKGKSIIRERNQTRDHTERMFKKFGIPIKVEYSNLKKSIHVSPPKEIRPCEIDICGDFSSAAFFILATLISPDSNVVFKNVGVNETRVGFVDALKKMGANINIKNLSSDYEPSADIEVKTSKLKGINLDKSLVSNVIDELPAFFIAAALAEGVTKIQGAEELRYKESDRLDSMAKCLNSFGVPLKISRDGIEIVGLNQSIEEKAVNPFKVAEIDSYGDHRVAMASAIGALRAKGECRIKNCANIATSFPNFLDISNNLGLTIKAD